MACKPIPYSAEENPSFEIITRSGAGKITVLEMVVDGVAYRKTYTYDGSNLLLTESVWVKQ